MDVHALTVQAVRDGLVCTLLLRGGPQAGMLRALPLAHHAAGWPGSAR